MARFGLKCAFWYQITNHGLLGGSACRLKQVTAGELVGRGAAIGAVSLGVIGAVAGLIVGLVAYPPTAWAAVFEGAIPGVLVGVVLGTLSGLLAAAFAAVRAGDSDP